MAYIKKKSRKEKLNEQRSKCLFSAIKPKLMYLICTESVMLVESGTVKCQCETEHGHFKLSLI